MIQSFLIFGLEKGMENWAFLDLLVTIVLSFFINDTDSKFVNFFVLIFVQARLPFERLILIETFMLVLA